LLLVIGYWLLVIGHWLLVVCCLLPKNSYPTTLYLAVASPINWRKRLQRSWKVNH